MSKTLKVNRDQITDLCFGERKWKNVLSKCMVLLSLYAFLSACVCVCVCARVYILVQRDMALCACAPHCKTKYASLRQRVPGFISFGSVPCCTHRVNKIERNQETQEKRQEEFSYEIQNPKEEKDSNRKRLSFRSQRISKYALFCVVDCRAVACCAVS